MRDYAEPIAELRLAAERKTITQKTRDACRDAADAIEELLAAVPKWISVEERLPEENQDVLLRFEHNMVVGFWQMYSGDRIWCANSGDELYVDCAVVEGYDTPTHWMPLPEPPKEV